MRTNFLWRYGPWIVVAIVAVAYYPRFIKDSDGMEYYPAAARCLLNHQLVLHCEPRFTYPPAFAFLMIPFVAMPLWLRDLVWYAVTIGAMIGSFKLSEMLARSSVDPPLDAIELRWMRLFSVVLSAKFVLAVLENQAYDALGLLFILLGLLALATSREYWGGTSLALAAAIKATPLIFLPYLLLKRRFVASAVFVVVLVGASYLPDLLLPPAGASAGNFNTWLAGIAGASFGLSPSVGNAFWSGTNLLNHSLHGAVSLLIDEDARHALHHEVLYAIDAAYIALLGALLVLSPRRKESLAIDGALLLISMLMLSPMTSRSHYVVLILPYTAIVALSARDRLTPSLGWLVLLASFILATATSNDVVGQEVTEWSYGHSFLVWGALVLVAYLAVVVWRRYRAECPRPISC